MKLILLRHGITAANEKHLYCGATDIDLSVGGKEALLLRARKMIYPDITVMRILTSGMKRCEETLQLLFGALPHETDPAFREMDFGTFEMRSFDELKVDPAYLDWIAGDNLLNVTPGGECGAQMQQRVLDGLERLLSENVDTLLVTHGGVIAVIMAHLFPAEHKNRYEWQPEPGGGYEISLSTGKYVRF